MHCYDEPIYIPDESKQIPIVPSKHNNSGVELNALSVKAGTVHRKRRGGEQMLAEIDNATRLFSICKNYPNKIVIGVDAFEKLKAEMKATGAMGLKVNLRGEYTSLFGMAIEMDNVNKDRVEIGYMQLITPKMEDNQ